jgi:phage terminase large subunit GpA-like protein
MTPTPIIDMDDWAEKHFHLPKTSYIPGLINLSLTPYNRQIMKDLSLSSPIRKVVYICGTQIAKSTIILIAFAYRVFCVIYGDMLYYFPDDGMAEKWSKTKLEDVIRANDFLRDALENRKRSDDNVTFKKTIVGALLIKGGKSGSKYRMDTGNFIVADDFADFPLNVGATTSGKAANKKTGEGAADKLLEDRGSGTGESAKIFINSSPKSENECPAWRSYQQTNKHHFFVKCPKCGTEQAWEFENVVIPHVKDTYVLTEEPWIECQNKECDHRVYQDDKYTIMQTGIWKPTVETRDEFTNGYRLPSVYSLLGYPLRKMAQDWLDACKSFDETGDESEKIRHRNSKQARPWKRKVGKSVNHSALYKTMENLEPLPENCVILSCGFDVQENPGRVEGQVNGFGPNNDRFIIDHQIFGGDPKIKPGLEGSPWNAVSDFILNKRYLNSFGQQQPIYCAAIDLGWGKEEAWIKHFIQNFQPHAFQQIFGVFGKEVTKGTINFIGKNATVDIDGFESWGVYSNIKRVSLRNLLQKHIENKESGNHSNFHIGDKPCFTEQFFRQMTIRRPDEHGIMTKPHDHARDEAESCWLYSEAGFILSFREFENGPDWDDFKDWNKKKLFIDNSERKANIVGNVF